MSRPTKTDLILCTINHILKSYDAGLWAWSGMKLYVNNRLTADQIDFDDTEIIYTDRYMVEHKIDMESIVDKLDMDLIDAILEGELHMQDKKEIFITDLKKLIQDCIRINNVHISIREKDVIKEKGTTYGDCIIEWIKGNTEALKNILDWIDDYDAEKGALQELSSIKD